MKTSICLLQTEYFPTTWFFARCMQYKHVLIEAYEHYQKRSYRNRCQISGPNGTVWLSVPLRKGKNRQCPIREVEIAYDEPWQSKHWHSIRSSYGKTPYFEHYEDLIRQLIFNSSPCLFDRNQRIIDTLLDELGLGHGTGLTDTYTREPDNIADLRGRNPVIVRPTDLPYMGPEYPQPFIHKYPFIPNLSILDLLFCTGPEAFRHLEQITAQLN